MWPWTRRAAAPAAPRSDLAALFAGWQERRPFPLTVAWGLNREEYAALCDAADRHEARRTTTQGRIQDFFDECRRAYEARGER